MDITAKLLFLVFHPAGNFPSLLEGKFDTFTCLKRMGKKIYKVFFFKFHMKTTLTFDQANKNNSVIYTLMRRHHITERVPVSIKVVMAIT